jgi:hypothetical protein
VCAHSASCLYEVKGYHCCVRKTFGGGLPTDAGMEKVALIRNVPPIFGGEDF